MADPGLAINKIPRKPNPATSQSLNPTCSPKIGPDNIATQIGAVNVIEDASARGSQYSPAKNKAAVATSRNDLNSCKEIFWVCQNPLPKKCQAIGMASNDWPKNLDHTTAIRLVS